MSDLTGDWIKELRRSVRRPAAVARPVVGRPTDDPRRSCLGRVSVLGAGETWPMFGGRPMASLAQLNLTESPHVPGELAGYAFISVWIAEVDGGLLFPDERANGEGWALRAYTSLDDLEPVEGHVLDWIQPRQLDWELIDDYPDWDDISDMVDDDKADELLDDEDLMAALGAAANGTKLGGWPALMQHEISWAPWNPQDAAPVYCLQIDSEESVNLNLWDNGVLHIGLGSIDGAPTWVAETQFM